MQYVIITGSLQFNTMRTMCNHNWLIAVQYNEDNV